MFGLLLFLTVVGWLFLSVFVAKRVGRSFRSPFFNRIATASTLGLLLALPFFDELVGKYQFQTLCRANGIDSADISKAKGKNVRVNFGGRRSIDGNVLPIKEADVMFFDEKNTPVIRHKEYYATGGWVVRHTSIGMGSNEPMLFHGNGCDQRSIKRTFADNQIEFSAK